MANNLITINNLEESDYNGLIMFSDIPNIVTYSNKDSGKKAEMTIVFNDNFTFIKDNETLTINGETVIATTDISKVGGRYFYTGGDVKQWIVPTMIDALRNCPNLAANYDIYMADEDGVLIDKVVIKAKTTGSKFNLSYDATDGFKAFDKYGDGEHITFDITDGTSTDGLKNTKNAIIQMQIYKSKTFGYNHIEPDTEEYITTLSKTYYETNVDFDISPVLSIFSEYGRLTHFRIVMSILSTNAVTPFRQIANISNLYSTIGFRTQNSQPYIPSINVPTLLQNVGNGIEWANLYPLYIYKPSISFSFLSDGVQTVNVKFLDSAFNIMADARRTTNNLPNNHLDTEIEFNSFEKYMFKQASYIAIELPQNRGNLLYKIVKGLKATDKCTRLYWRNEMGGISFFDFTGQHQEDIKIDSTTYNKGDFDYYRSKEREKTIIYSKDITHQYTVTSHIIEYNGTKVIESLAKTQKAWIVDDEYGTIENILITDVKINELQEYDDLYTITVSYSLSREN